MKRLPMDRACAALLRALGPAIGPFTIVSATSRPWASALFLGSRHRLILLLKSGDAETRALRLQAEIGEAELDFPGGFVADIHAMAERDEAGLALLIEALTIDEPEPDPSIEAISRDGWRAC